MLGLDDYGSDSDSTHSNSQQADSASQKSAAKPRRAPKKFTIALPTISSNDDNKEKDFERPAKKRKTGAGVSSLLSILPTPKQKNPVSVSATQRVLSPSGFTSATLTETTGQGDETDSTSTFKTDGLSENLSTTVFRPTALARGKKNISVEEHSINQPQAEKTLSSTSSEPRVDFFSIGDYILFVWFITWPNLLIAGATISQTSAKTSIPSSTPLPNSSSAPAIPTFEPPEPTPTDAYPGYYQLPSGGWAAYDPAYYNKFANKWQEEYNAHVRALEKGAVKGFEALEDSAVDEFNAMKEMERAKKEIQEREERKAITMGAGGGPVAPRMTINVCFITHFIDTCFEPVSRPANWVE